MTTAMLHNPGGKIARKLPSGMIGDAGFLGPSGEYRQWLFRAWGINSHENPSYALWLGLNPSTASGDKNDPTILREIDFTTNQCRLSAYYKVNCVDYRSTNPKGLLASSVNPRSESNLDIVRDLASRATMIVVACGIPHRSIQKYAIEAISLLRKDARELWCLGRTAAGWPRHPLYLSSKTPLELFK